MDQFEKLYNEIISQFEGIEQPEAVEEITQNDFMYYEMVSRIENDFEVAEWYELTGEIIR